MFGFGKKAFVVGAPMAAEVVDVSKLSDPAFAENVIGPGTALRGGAGAVLAPADGVVETMFDTGHAVSMTTDFGAEILIHIGIDTVTLKGKHFTKRKASGDRVKTGDTLIEYDPAGIEADGFDTSTPIIVCNPDDFSEITFAPEGAIAAGAPLITLKK